LPFVEEAILQDGDDDRAALVMPNELSAGDGEPLIGLDIQSARDGSQRNLGHGRSLDKALGRCRPQVGVADQFACAPTGRLADVPSGQDLQPPDDPFPEVRLIKGARLLAEDLDVAFPQLADRHSLQRPQLALDVDLHSLTLLRSKSCRR
jgi:hypothetical protein